MAAYYNEIDHYAAEWLRNLIAAGHLPDGDVDTRSIVDIRPDDLRGYDQCHFFAGIGGWPLALRLAGWPDDRPVWTGSCPCQPFSAAGKRRGVADERHLWPEFLRLIAECRPPVVLGEQVASSDGRRWLSGVRADLEALDYGVGAADLCAASVGAPHIRQRLWWVADAMHAERRAIDVHGEDGHHGSNARRPEALGDAGTCGALCDPARRLADADGGLAGDGRLQPGRQHGQQPQDGGTGCGLAIPKSEQSHRGGSSRRRRRESPDGCGLGDADQSGPQGRNELRHGAGERSPWAASWLGCTDGKARRAEPVAQCLANGISYCLGQLSPDQEEEIADAAHRTGIGDEVLRALRDRGDAAALWQSLGGCIGFSKATLLFAVMFKQSRELGNFIVGAASSFSEACEAEMRGMREGPASARASCRSKYSQQRAAEFADIMHSLSSGFASLNRFTGSPLAVGVTNRVGKLRAYGNAIVPQVAEEFIRAYMRYEVASLNGPALPIELEKEAAYDYTESWKKIAAYLVKRTGEPEADGST